MYFHTIEHLKFTDPEMHKALIGTLEPIPSQTLMHPSLTVAFQYDFRADRIAFRLDTNQFHRKPIPLAFDFIAQDRQRMI
jgi:hypothetical protein